MEEKVPLKFSMVSRLPKFGARPAGGTSASLPNGSPQALPPQDGRPNGLVRTSSFSLKWRKETGGPATSPSSPEENALPAEKRESRAAALPGSRELKKPSTPSTPSAPSAPSTPSTPSAPSTPSTKVRRSASAVSASSPKPIPKSSRAAASPKLARKLSQPSANQSLELAQAPGPSKPAQNGSAGAGAAGAPGRSGSGPLRPRANSSSPRSSSRDILSQSSDSLKSLSLDNMVRSQSFTHFKQLPSPTNVSMTRSFSFNKAVELAKPLANTQLRPPRTPGLKPPQSLPSGRLSLGVGGIGFGKGFSDRPLVPAPTPRCQTPPSALKKPLLPSCVLSKAPALGYRLPRTSTAKAQRPLLAGRSQQEEGGDQAETEMITPPLSPEVPPSDKVSTPGEHAEGYAEERDAETSLRYLAEGLEDMSLSSASSLERNDTSDEFFDDFDNLGDQSSNGVPDNRHRRDTPSQTRLRGFLSERVDWAAVSLAAGKAGPGGSRGSLLMSPEMDFPPGSSLELSPSNSSGGTYMWDEEGLEPLGPPLHRRSYESDLNSIDVLNNLDNLESCDLEDDDLMLDGELPEDVSLHSDGMAHHERSERGGRPGNWRRRPPRWAGPDHFYNDNRPVVAQGYDGCHASLRPLHSVVRADSHTVALDELTVKHMAQDCSSVKSQLLKLKSLLQLEDSSVIQDPPEAAEDSSTALQQEELMREVANLREELRNKDRIIAQLTHKQQQQQWPVRCQCQQRAQSLRGEKRPYHDKATQTPWRGPTPQILQPSSLCPSEPPTQGRVARPAPTGVRSDPHAWRGEPVAPSPALCMDTTQAQGAFRPLSDPEELSLLLSAHLRIHDNRRTGGTDPPGSADAPSAEPRHRAESRAEASPLLSEVAPPLTLLGPRVLQPPRLHKRVSVPALPPRAGGGAAAEARLNAKPVAVGNRMPRQLPPPSRGLPCLGVATRAPSKQGPGRWESQAGVEGAEDGCPAGQTPLLSHSVGNTRLPKPKTHSEL